MDLNEEMQTNIKDIGKIMIKIIMYQNLYFYTIKAMSR